MIRKILYLSIAFILCFNTIYSNLNVGYATEFASTKKTFENYVVKLANLDEVTDKDLPLGEYNEFLINQLNNVDYNKYQKNFMLDKIEWNSIWLLTKELFGIKAFTEEEYTLILRDIISKIGEIEKSDAEKYQGEINKIVKTLKATGKFDALLTELDENDIQIKAYTVINNDFTNCFKILSGVDVNKGISDNSYPLANDIFKLYATATHDYTSCAKYLDILKSIIYDIASSENNSGNANALINAFDKVYLEYHNNFYATASELGKQINSRLKNEAISQLKELIKLKLSDIGLGVIASKFLSAADIAIFLKDLAMENDGTHQEVEAVSKLSLSIGLTKMFQYRFVDDSKKVLKDNFFSDDDYNHMNDLFNICKCIQSLNYDYVNNLDVDGFWYNVHKAADLPNEKYGFVADEISNNYLIDRYLGNTHNTLNSCIIDGGQCGETLYWEFTDKGELIIFGNGNMYNSNYSEGITLLPGFPVGEKHWDNSKVISVSFYGNITSLGGSAFCGNISENMLGEISDTRCINLKEITLPESLKTIAPYTFANCINLETVNFNTSIEEIGYAAFSGCSKLKYIKLPNTVRHIGEQAFYNCPINTFEIPSGLTKLTTMMLANTKIETLIIPETVTEIEADFFYEMKSIKNVYMYTKHDVYSMGVHDLVGNYSFNLYGYDNAKTWVEKMNKPNVIFPQVNFINYIPLSNSPTTDSTPKIEDNINVPCDTFSSGVSPSIYLNKFIYSVEITPDNNSSTYIFKIITSPDIKDIGITEYFDNNTAKAADIISSTSQVSTDSTEWTVKISIATPGNHKYRVLACDDIGSVVKTSPDLYIETVQNQGNHQPTSGNSKFSDVPASHKFSYDINRLAQFKLLNGYDDGTFKPDQNLTRAEFCAVVCRAMACNDEDVKMFATDIYTTYTDVPTNHWAAGYINYAGWVSIINGFGDKTFRPDDIITYNQAIKMMVATVGYTPEVEKYGGYPDGYIKVAQNIGLTNGMQTFQGETPISRGELAKLTSNAIDIPVMVKTHFNNQTQITIMDGTNDMGRQTLLDNLSY